MVLGVVTPVGTDVDFVQRVLAERLEQFDYTLKPIRLSGLIGSFRGLSGKLDGATYFERVSNRMDGGNEVRQLSRRGDALALAAIGRIRESRKDLEAGKPRPRTAYFLRSLKHPDEVRTLREVYGPGFFSIGVAAPPDRRLEFLRGEKAVSEDHARALLLRDEREDAEHGQQTRDAFHLSDAFVSLGPDEMDNKRQLWRLLDLLFGHPFITPWQDEYAMFLAYAASLRSADLSRQVGAIVVSADGEIIATGANDVPSSGGGQYWSERYVDWPTDEPTRDHRDWTRGCDSNKKRRREIVEEVAGRLLRNERKRVRGALEEVAHGRFDAGDAERALGVSGGDGFPSGFELERMLDGAAIMDLTEYGRAVHAEMAALLCCARVGVSPAGGALYCTTFPCHNCTKHIVAAGLKRVFYIEPYPKSLAEELHGDAVLILSGDGPEPNDARVVFRPFTGVGPRRFIDLFSMSLSTGRPMDRKGAVPKNWFRKGAQLRLSMVTTSYMEREEGALATLDDAIPGGHDEHPEE